MLPLNINLINVKLNINSTVHIYIRLFDSKEQNIMIYQLTACVDFTSKIVISRKYINLFYYLQSPNSQKEYLFSY